MIDYAYQLIANAITTKGNEMARTMTPKEVALELGTDARTLRKFLRTIETVDSPGKGGRYAIEARKVNSLKKGFNAWIDAKRSNAPDSDN